MNMEPHDFWIDLSIMFNITDTLKKKIITARLTARLSLYLFVFVSDCPSETVTLILSLLLLLHCALVLANFTSDEVKQMNNINSATL